MISKPSKLFNKIEVVELKDVNKFYDRVKYRSSTLNQNLISPLQVVTRTLFLGQCCKKVVMHSDPFYT